jgi:ribose transport system substrate-binding protein
MKRSFFLTAAVLLIAGTITLGSCTKSGTETGSGEGSGQKTIGIVLKTLNSEYWSCVKAGILQAEKDFGVKVILQGPASETSFDEWQSMVETMLSAGEVQALVLSPLQPDTAAKVVANATIPVLAVDTTFVSPKLLSYVGISNENATYAGGKYVGEKIGAGSKVAILAGVQGDLTSEDRIKGWRRGIEETGGSVLTVQYTDAATDKAVAVMEGLIQMYPQGTINAVVCHSDDVAMGAANAITQANRKDISVCGFGGISGAQPVKSGILTASVDIGPYVMGYTVVQKAIDAIDGKPVESFIDAGATILDQSNIDEFLVKLAEWTK